METCTDVPLRLDDRAQTLWGGTNEHKVVEELAHLVGRVGAHIEVGHKVVEGLCTGLEVSPPFPMQHGLNLLWTEMSHDMPLPTGGRILVCLFVHIYFSALSDQRCLRRTDGVLIYSFRTV